MGKEARRPPWGKETKVAAMGKESK